VSGTSGPRTSFLVGPTAVGKTAVAQVLAEQRRAAVLSADSMLIYRGMDIGTAKPTSGERGHVPYYGMDLAGPEALFSAWDYRRYVLALLAELPDDGELIVTGGTGLYIKSLTHGLVDRPGGDAGLREAWEVRLHEAGGFERLQQVVRETVPEIYEALADKQNPRRLIRALETAGGVRSGPGWQHERSGGPVLIGLSMVPELLNARIARRVQAMYAQGFIAEVEQLLASGATLSKTARQAIGYAEAIDLIEGRLTEAQAVERTTVRTRRLAKRQRTWFRHQAEVIWVEVTESSTVASLAEHVSQLWREHGPTAIKRE